MNTEDTWDALPDELYIHVLSFLSVSELSGYGLVNKRANRLAHDEAIWKDLVVKKFNLPVTHLEKQQQLHQKLLLTNEAQTSSSLFSWRSLYKLAATQPLLVLYFTNYHNDEDSIKRDVDHHFKNAGIPALKWFLLVREDVEDLEGWFQKFRETLFKHRVLLFFATSYEVISPDLGDMLAEYVECGNTVIVCPFGFNAFGGRFSPTFCPIKGSTSFTKERLGQLVLPEHPILEGIHAIESIYCINSSGYHDDASIIALTHPSAQPLIVQLKVPATTTTTTTTTTATTATTATTPNTGKVIAINVFPPSCDLKIAGGWRADEPSDVARLFANTFFYALSGSWQ